MSPPVDDYLNHLLTTFDATSLGEGDSTAGANLLTAMACSLANIAPPGSGLVTKDGATIKVGSSLLVTGSHSASLVTDSVLVELGRKQNNFNSILRHEIRQLQDAQLKAPGARSTPDAPANLKESTIEMLRNPGAIHPRESAGLWAGLTEEPAQANFGELLQHHKVFITGGTPAQLEKQLEYSHLGRPLIHAGVDKPSDFERLGTFCPTVMDGRAAGGPLADNIRGTVVVTDPSAVLGDAIRAGNKACGWLGRLPWLVDGEAGPEPPQGPCEKAPALDNVNQRYDMALRSAWGRRIDSQNTKPVTYEYSKFDLTEIQARWIAFLRLKEAEFPGITGTARNLLTTLVFGLMEMVQATSSPAGFKWYIDGIQALARMLVHRMINARAAILWSAEDAWRRQQQERMIFFLRDGSHSTRALCRRFHRMSANLLYELGLELVTAGRVAYIDDQWQLTQSEVRVAAEALTLNV